MSNEELEKYKKLYSMYIQSVIEMHDINLRFLANIGVRSGFNLRAQTRKIITLQHSLYKSSKLVYKENMENDKKRKALSKQKREIAKKLHAEGRYKNDKRNRPTKDTV